MAQNVTTKLAWRDGLVCDASFEGVTPVKVTAKSNLEKYPGAWSPVHMLVSSIETCFFVTFLFIAAKAHVEISSYQSEAEGMMDAPDGKHSAITTVAIRPRVGLTNEMDRSKLTQLFEKTEEYCTVGNSLNFKVKVL